jgi:hypothetical protein
MILMALHSCQLTQRRAPQLAHLPKLANYDQGPLYGAEYRILYIGNDVDNVEMLQSLCQVGAWMLTSLSGPTEPL